MLRLLIGQRLAAHLQMYQQIPAGFTSLATKLATCGRGSAIVNRTARAATRGNTARTGNTRAV